jgi:hypothetical protein
VQVQLTQEEALALAECAAKHLAEHPLALTTGLLKLVREAARVLVEGDDAEPPALRWLGEAREVLAAPEGER